MADWLLAAVRFGLYGGLGLIFGMPAFLLMTAAGASLWRQFRLDLVLAVLAVLGLVLSLLGFLLTAARMSAMPLTALDPGLLEALLRESAVGRALMVRITALLVFLCLALLLPVGRKKSWLLVICGAFAVGSLAWSGHAASGAAVIGLVHLGSDIVHMLAASTWLGALLLLLALVRPGGDATRERAGVAHVALEGFGRTGTIAVILIVMTGITNLLLTVDFTALPELGTTTYGWLILLKIAIFAGMLGCAVFNRYGLTPALKASIEQGESRPSLSGLRRSIALEASLAICILALVGWLGMLDPGGG